ncbi:uncharacterized protein LOC129918054 [Episyrphus balteatus]|uniref:uncharacterized protein LOC129918054 n=1 Tax=Episyrphus balteatus TaxID=286459 RepID=UPI0024863C7C|nr:uncharacterized protein LOC129918054 [Episyrphus balteatus]
MGCSCGESVDSRGNMIIVCVRHDHRLHKQSRKFLLKPTRVGGADVAAATLGAGACSILPVFFGGTTPGVIISKTANNDTIIRGYMGNIFNAFAKKHNAKLNTSNINTSILPYYIRKSVVNGTFEISGAFPIFIQQPTINYSYPFLFYDWCVMLPIEPNIPIYKVFTLVFHWEAFVPTIVILISLSASLAAAFKFSGSSHRNIIMMKCDYLLNIDCFRGMLGQSISESPNASFSMKLIYSLIFLLGIMIVTSYNAFIQSFITEPPREPMISSFEDLKSSGLKVYVLKTEFDNLLKRIT